jgi:hypothetical protein
MKSLPPKLKKYILKEVALMLQELDAATSPGDVPVKNLTKKELIDVIKTSIPGNTKPDKIMDKFPSLKEVILDLFTEVYNDYVEDIFVIAPKPTVFKVILKNAQLFYLTYSERGYMANISGKNYFLPTLEEKQRALKALFNLLNIGNVPPSPGPDLETSGPSKEDDNFSSEKPKGKPTGRPPSKDKEKEEEPDI